MTVRFFGGSLKRRALALGWLLSAACGDEPLADEQTDINAVSERCAAPGGAYRARERTYYIAAEEIDWDYAPSDQNVVAGRDFNEDEALFVADDVAGTLGQFVGDTYRKAVYVEYTDDTFATPKPVADQWRHKGILGPVIRGVVGDTIRVVFKNNTPERAYSVHPHGVFYEKSSEGAGYADGTSGDDKHDDAVAPGALHTYTWQVPERAGPGPQDGSSIVWPYHSHVNSIADSNAGLIGPMVITAAGCATDSGEPADVDVEVLSLFAVMDENVSILSEDNTPPNAALADPDELEESNLMHVINGYVWGNGPRPRMRVGDRVRWYLLGMGTEVDLHTPHWHGNTVLEDHHRRDVVELLPASTKTVDMVPDAPGTWLYHCHVNDHIAAGMIGLYDVAP